MNTTTSVRVRSADAFPRIQSPTQEGLTPHVNNEALWEKVFIVATVDMATFLSYVCYHALQNYGAS